MSPGKEPLDLENVLLTQTPHVDYKELCRLDVLGLSDTTLNNQSSMLNLKSSLCEIRRVGMRLVCPGEGIILCYRTTMREVCADSKV